MRLLVSHFRPHLEYASEPANVSDERSRPTTTANTRPAKACAGTVLCLRAASLHSAVPLARIARHSTPRIRGDAGVRCESTAIPQVVNSAVSPSLYTYTRQTTRRNLYRIQLPY
jgi:hypothetical protein